jgi:acyl carrier protein
MHIIIEQRLKAWLKVCRKKTSCIKMIYYGIYVKFTSNNYCLNHDELFSRLKEFVIKQSCVDDEEITPETKISDDLGVSGDDAVEFITAFGREFNVDVSHFMAADYFEPEGDVILPAILRFLTGRKKEQKKVLTVDHLEKAVIAGRLDEEVINR